MIFIASAGAIALLSTIFITLGMKTKVDSIDDYVAHRGKSSVTATACSLAASALGAWILFSPAETASLSGITGLVGYAIGCAVPIFLLALFGPKLIAQLPMGYGFGDYVRSRFGTGTSLFVIILMLFYMGTFLTGELTAIGGVLDSTMGIPPLAGCAIIMLLVFAYVFRGGLGASINTDKIQLYVLFPLLVILSIAIVRSLTGNGPLLKQINDSSPTFFSLSSLAGWKNGILLFIAVTVANIFDQGFWQRVYSVNRNKSMKKAFLLGGTIVIPAIMLAGFFGIFARTTGTLERPDQAIFSLLPLVHPTFTVILVVLAFVLVISSIDSLLNGIMSTIMSWPSNSENDKKKLRLAQCLTILAGLLAVYIGSLGISVLYLFLIADLLCAAFAFPLVFGLFNKKLTGPQAMISGSIGLILGAPFFPLADYSSSWSGLPPDMLTSFLVALLASTVISLLLTAFTIRKHN